MNDTAQPISSTSPEQSSAQHACREKRLRRLRTLLNIIFGFCAAVVLIWLYAKAQSVDLNRHSEITSLLRQLRELDARWNEHVLKLKLNLLNEPDPLNQTIISVTAQEQKLTTALAEQNTLSSRLADLHTAAAKKTQLTQQFKEQNALLRHSLNSIPTAVRELHDAVEQNKTLFSNSEQLIYLETQAQELLQNLLKYNLSPRNDLAQFVDIQSRFLESAADGAYTESINARLATVANHARAILTHKPTVDALVNSILAVPLADAIDRLFESYNALHEQRLLQNEHYRRLLIGYSALLLVWIVLIARRLHNSYRQLDLANAQLEQRVEERTRELKLSQAKLIQSEKMASLGQMVAGVVHEINTPLAYTRSNVVVVNAQLPLLVSLLEQVEQLAIPDQTSDDAEKKAAQLTEIAATVTNLRNDGILEDMSVLLDASISGLDQIADLVVNLRNFSRLDRRKIEPADLNESLNSVLIIAGNLLKNRITIIKDYGEIPKVSCSPSQINQVLLNLIVNAAQAIQEHGTITLHSSVRDDFVDLIIADDGPGIPQDVLPHIFDPFFTTKSIGEGTGLGLSIAYQIVQEHQGTITVDSTPEQGARFTVSLPINRIQKTLDAAA